MFTSRSYMLWQVSSATSVFWYGAVLCLLRVFGNYTFVTFYALIKGMRYNWTLNSLVQLCYYVYVYHAGLSVSYSVKDRTPVKLGAMKHTWTTSIEYSDKNVGFQLGR